MKLMLYVFLIMMSTITVAETDKSWDFEVFLNDEKIGDHQFVIKNDGESEKVFVKARFNVKFLFFTAYQYEHSNIESWKNGCLSSLQSVTDDNGDQFTVNANKLQSKLSVVVNNISTQIDDECIRTFAYWDQTILESSKLLNSQNGKYMPVDVVNVGLTNYKMNDSSVPANHYKVISEKFTVDLWYSDQGDWLGLASTTEDGHRLNYRLR